MSRLLKESSPRLDTLVSQFLELARAEAGMLHEERSRVDLAALARGLVEAMDDDSRFAGVRFTVTGAERAEIVGVAYRVESVLRNLLETAASFSGEGGEVNIDIVLPGEGRVELRVSDTGPGIAEEELPRVFQRFFTTRGRERGSGLGLAFVRAVVEAHGGGDRGGLVEPRSGRDLPGRAAARVSGSSCARCGGGDPSRCLLRSSRIDERELDARMTR